MSVSSETLMCEVYDGRALVKKVKIKSKQHLDCVFQLVIASLQQVNNLPTSLSHFFAVYRRMLGCKCLRSNNRRSF